MIDPLGLVLTEIRDDPGVAALTDRIRGGEQAAGDGLGPGKYNRFVVLVRLGGTRERRAPVQEVRLAARCYGVTFQDAAALAGAVSDAVHAAGPRLASSGIGIYGSFEDSGLGATRDPDTDQPHEDLILRIVSPTVKVNAPMP